MRALPLAVALLVGCASHADRYEAGNKALSEGDGLMYSVVIAPVLQEALNDCIPSGTEGAAPMLMVLADVLPDGAPTNVVVEPDSKGSGCLKERIEASRFFKPPLEPGQESFPIGVRIETAY